MNFQAGTNRYPSLDLAVKTFFSAPGTNAAGKLRIKDKAKLANLKSLCGQPGPMVDLTMRSMVNHMLIFYFDKDAAHELSTQLATNLLFAFNPSEDIKKSLSCWLSSQYGSKDYVKYIRDSRSLILASWLNIMRCRPASVILHSLDKYFPYDICVSDGQSKLFKSDAQLSIFGIYGWYVE
jgi:hypothetical protein